MKNLSLLLKRVSSWVDKDQVLKERICLVFKNKTGFELNSDKFVYKEGVLELRLGASLNQEARLKEDLIKETLLEEYGIKVLKIFYR